MIRAPLARRVALVCSLFSLLALAGCFETKLVLGPRDSATVDPAFCGDWNVQDHANPSGPPSVQIVVRNLDGRNYLAEWTEKGKDGQPDKTQRMIAFTADVKGVTFAHLRDLPTDGTLPDQHLVQRVSVKDGVLTLRNLNKEFFDAQKLETDADFRRVVEENLENESMYDEGTVTAVRAGG